MFGNLNSVSNTLEVWHSPGNWLCIGLCVFRCFDVSIGGNATDQEGEKVARFVTSTHYSWLKPHTPAASSIHFHYPHTAFSSDAHQEGGCATD